MKFKFSLRNSRLLRILSVTLLLSVTANIIYPTVTYALTSGPNAPEYTSFEPVDITDMVNLATGDFTYSIPLIEVPGPEGGYPIGLSYHANIMPEEEASWVGLGWTLNVGAINRTVNSYADDLKGGGQGRTDDWEGGETDVTSVGVGYGYGIASVNVGLSFAQDTYQGFGVGWSVGVGVGLGQSGVGLNASIGQGPYGGRYVSLGISASTAGSSVQASASLGVVHSLDDGSTTVYGGVGISVGKVFGNAGAFNALDISMDSKGLSPSASPAGITASSSNSNAKNLTINTSAWNVSIPIPTPVGMFNISFGESHTRYYMHQNDFEYVYGSLYANHVRNIYQGTKTSFDSYAFPDPANTDPMSGNPNKEFGGNMPSFDSYLVLGQGIQGSMQPCLFDNGNLYRFNTEDVKFENSENLNGFLDDDKGKPAFRFLNDFSNRLTRDVELSTNLFPGSSFNPSDPSMVYGTALDAFSHVGKTDINFNSAKANGAADFKKANRQLAGSKHVEWFSNKEIISGEANNKGFIAYDERFDARRSYFQLPTGASYSVENQIGGFMVTNERGLTYHYSLPVYAYEDYSRTHIPDKKYTFETWHIQPYAYTWLLTGVTGPDYVDRGNPGMDPSDWGHYVRFDYGKWTDQYTWRNPVSGVNKDIDGSANHYSSGKKELYYLDAVQTRTHIALFVKDIRNDSKGVSSAIFGGFNIFDVTNNPIYVSQLVGAGDDLFSNNDVRISKLGKLTNDTKLAGSVKHTAFHGIPVSTLKLSKILLFNTMALNRKLNYAAEDGKGSATEINLHHLKINSSPNYLMQSNTGSSQPISSIFASANTRPNKDKDNNSITYVETEVNVGTKNVIRESVSKDISYYHNATEVLDVYDLSNGIVDAKGKTVSLSDLESIALKNISFNHDYDLCKNAPNSFYLDYRTISPTTSVSTKTGKLSLKSLSFKGTDGNETVPPISFEYAKNPNYTEQKFDIWGNWKSDYNVASDLKNSRETSVASKDNLDAWSLTKIKTSLGATINITYEPDDYSSSPLSPYINYAVSSALFEQGTNEPINSIYMGLFSDELIQNIVNNAFEIWFTGLVATTDGTYTDENGEYFPTNVKLVDPIQVSLNSGSVANGYFKISGNDNSQILNQFESIFYTTIENESTIKHIIPNRLICGNLLVKPKTRFGGGIRVKEITVSNSDISNSKESLYSKTTTYNYSSKDSQNNDISSGTCTYAPTDNNIFEIETSFGGSLKTAQEEGVKQLRNKFLTGRFTNQGEINANRMFLPSPGVIYSKVTVQDKGTGGVVSASKVEYQFSTFSDFHNKYDLRTKFVSADNQKAYVRLRNFTNGVGLLKKVITYGKSATGDEVILNTKENYYLHHDKLPNSAIIDVNSFKSFDSYISDLKSLYNDQGRVDQLYHENRSVSGAGYQMVLTEVEDYPIVPIGSKNTDYKTGIVSVSQNLAFDYYTGDAMVVKSIDEYGNHYIAQTVPAYEKYPEMGLKTENPANKQMLSQIYGNYLYKVPSDYTYSYGDILKTKENVGLVGASVQTWSNTLRTLYYDDKKEAYVIDNQTNILGQASIWRKDASYVYSGEPSKLLADGTIANFSDYSIGNQFWKLNGKITLYDTYSHELEATDINGNYAATLMTPAADINHHQQQVLASCSNAKYGEFTHCGAEYYFDYDDNNTLYENGPGNSIYEGGVSIGESIVNPSTRGLFCHTGKQAIYVPKDKTGFDWTMKTENMQKDAQGNPSNTYSASVWVYLPGSSEGDGSQATLNAAATLSAKVGDDPQIDAHPVSGRKAGSWYLITLENIVPKAGKDIRVWVSAGGGRGAYVDDFRVQPMASNMSAYIYDRDFGRVTEILDNDNFYTRFKYDASGRLTLTAKEIIYSADKIVNQKITRFKGL